VRGSGIERRKIKRNEHKQKQNKTNKNNNKQPTEQKNNFHPNSEIPNSMPAPYIDPREPDGEPKYECVRGKTREGHRQRKVKENSKTKHNRTETDKDKQH
jgi:hypothetical protein